MYIQMNILIECEGEIAHFLPNTLAEIYLVKRAGTYQ